MIFWCAGRPAGGQEVKVPYSERVAIYTGPESCAGGREAIREALTGVRVGQPLSGEKSIWVADALEMAEGNMNRRDNASACLPPRRLRPWHVRTSSAREPGDLQHHPPSLAGRIGKANGRSR